MKTLLNTVGLMLISAIGLNAQSLDEVVKLYQYNRYASAAKAAQPLAATNAQANYYLGLCALAEDRVADAKGIFQKYPDDAANNAGLARVMFLENNKNEAMAMLAKVASKAKKKVVAPFKYAADAITYTEGGDPNVAIDWYKKAIEENRSGDLYIGMGDAYRKLQGGGGNAMTNYEYAETYPGTQSLANYKMGTLWYAAKNYDSALAKFGRASEQDAMNPLPYKALADAYYRVGKYKLSKDKIEKYLDLSDKTIDDQIQYANTLYLAKEYNAAVSKMNDLIGKRVEKPYMYRVLAFSQYELKQCQEAKKNMDIFFSKQDPKKTIPLDYINYGKMLLCDSTTADDASANFMKGLAMDTAADKSTTMREIAEACKDQNKFLLAGEWYKKLSEYNSPNVEPTDYWWSGVMYYYGKNYDASEGMFKIMSEKYPKEPSSFYWLGRVTAANKDKEYKNGAATPYFNQWLGMVNDDPAKKNDLIKAYTYLAMIAYNNKQNEDAKKYCAKLQGFDPNDNTAKQILKALEGSK